MVIISHFKMYSRFKSKSLGFPGHGGGSAFRSNAVSRVMRRMRVARKAGYGVKEYRRPDGSLPPNYRQPIVYSVPLDRVERERIDPLYNIAMTAQDAASAVGNALVGASRLVIDQTIRRLEQYAGHPIEEIPGRVAYAFARTVAEQMAVGVPLAVALREAASAAGSFGRGAVRYVFRRRR